MKEKFISKVSKYLNDIGLYRYISDENYLKSKYKHIFGKELDLNNPKTFNEKIQWLKLNDRKDVYTTMADKCEAKKYVSSIIGDEYIIPTLGVWNKFSDIDFDELPNQFVLKCTHDSGGLLICKDKNELDLKKAKMKFDLIMKRNFYYRNREWQYKNIKPRIIAEKYMGNNLTDYKFFCFNGIPEIILTCTNRKSKEGLNEDFFDINWNHLELRRPNHENAIDVIEKPINLEKMIKLSKELSASMKFLRVDFYEIDSNVFFGELTFYPAGGFEGFEPQEWDEKLGELIKIDR